MKFNPVTFIIVFSFVYPLLKGFLLKYSSNDFKSDIHELNSNISFIVSLILGVYLTRRIFIQHETGWYSKIFNYIPREIAMFLESKPLIVYIIIMPLIIYLIYKILLAILSVLNSLTLYPVFDGIERSIKNRNSFIKRIFGAMVELPKSLCYIFIATLALNLISISINNPKLNYYIKRSDSYKYICRQVIIPVTNSKLAKQLPNILDNSFKIVVKDTSKEIKPNDIPKKSSDAGKVTVYYNGVTLEEGIKSNEQIDGVAREIAAGAGNAKDKASIIYKWVGSNITYDQEKVDRVLNNDYNIKSGAIETFQTRKGICFDFSCLYVAMSRANGIKVRLITGEGFNGVSWVSHAWNQVYIPEKNQWINVDATFYRGGNYFDSRRFELDHRNPKVAGEW